MCGPDLSNKPRGGALVALGPTRTQSTSGPGNHTWFGELTFHTPGDPGSIRATHVRLTAGADSDIARFTEGVVLIHRSGDLTKTAEECGQFHKFAFTQATMLDNGNALEMALQTPLSLEVGDGGVIGRRVSVFPHSLSTATGLHGAVAEGIVGFNFLHTI